LYSKKTEKKNTAKFEFRKNLLKTQNMLSRIKTENCDEPQFHDYEADVEFVKITLV